MLEAATPAAIAEIFFHMRRFLRQRNVRGGGIGATLLSVPRVFAG
jgi:hypothetical protein